MKSIHKTVFQVACLSLIGSGCGPGAFHPQNGVFRAEVLKTITLSDHQDPGGLPKFEIGVGDFYSLKNLNELSGDYFSIFKGGQLRVKSVIGSIVETTGYVGGATPAPRFHIHNETIVPDDQDTFLMFSNYYQFEQVARVLDQATGITMDELKAKRGIIKILFYPLIHGVESSPLGPAAVNQFDTMNAAFDPRFFQFLIMPSSKVEDVPLGNNLQVIAHEFGHYIFDHILLDSDPEDGYLKHYSLRGLNEGFADFVSYSITGSSHILGGSLGLFINSQRNFSKVRFNYFTIDETPLTSSRYSNNDLKCNGKFYCIGTVFAKALYQAKQRSHYSSNTVANRYAFLRQVIGALQAAKTHLDQDSVVVHLRKATEQEIEDAPKGEPLGAFFRAFITGFSDANTGRLVRDSLTQEFGTQGFPNAFR